MRIKALWAKVNIFNKISFLLVIILFFSFFSTPGLAIHKGVYRIDPDEKGKKHRVYDQFFGSCIACREILSDVVETITND